MRKLSREKSERAIAAVLRYGSLIGVLVMAMGLAIMLLRGPGALANYHHLRLAVLLPNLVRLDPAALTEAGILLLLLTPIFRIVVAVVSFALERDSKYVWISLGVLAVVLFSIGFAIEG